MLSTSPFKKLCTGLKKQQKTRKKERKEGRNERTKERKKERMKERKKERKDRKKERKKEERKEGTIFQPTWATSNHPPNIVWIVGPPIHVVRWLHPHTQLTTVGETHDDAARFLHVGYGGCVARCLQPLPGHETTGVWHAWLESNMTRICISLKQIHGHNIMTTSEMSNLNNHKRGRLLQLKILIHIAYIDCCYTRQGSSKLWSCHYDK